MRRVFHLVHTADDDCWRLESGGVAVAAFSSREDAEAEGENRCRALRRNGVEAELVIHVPERAVAPAGSVTSTLALSIAWG